MWDMKKLFTLFKSVKQNVMDTICGLSWLKLQGIYKEQGNNVVGSH